MKKYICRTLFELMYVIPELKTYRDGILGSSDMREAIEIIEEKNPFPDYELFNAAPTIFIFKIKQLPIATTVANSFEA